MRVIIAGSRKGFDALDVYEAVANSPFGWKITEVVSGTARGVDSFGEQWAEIYGIPVKRFPADWDQYRKAAGYIRNGVMADYADALIAVWDGKSPGTKHMIEHMKQRGKLVFVYDPNACW